MKFSIVIPTVNQDAMLLECLDTFFKFHGKEHEVIVVDDGSKPDLQARIKAFCDVRGVKSIMKPNNSGFPITANMGIKAATGDVIVMVNNDIIFTCEILKQIEADMIKDPKIGVIGALLYYPNQTIQHGGILRVGGYGFTHLGWHKTYHQAPEVHHPKYLLGVTGAIFAIRRETIDQVGMFDEGYFLACDDTQYCIRCWQHDWKVYFDPKVTAIHVEGGTRGASTQEKLGKSQQTRDWYLKENYTQAKFLSWLKTIDLVEVDRRVNEANLTVGASPAPHSVPQSKEPTPLPQIQKVTVQTTKPIGQFDRDLGMAKIIGIRRTGALGDVMLATPIVRELKRRYPDSQIYFATHCPDALFGNPYITDIVRNIGELQDLTNVVYDLDMAYESNPKMHVIEAYSKIVFGHGISDYRIDLVSGSKDFDEVSTILGGAINFERDKVVVLHMSVGWPNRTWPKDSWNTVVKQLATRGYKTVIIGRGGDYRADLVGGVINCNDRFSVRHTREIIKRAQVFVGPDSGMMHVAQTTETPCVAMFTVANPSYRITRPKGTVSLVPTSPCRGCLHDAPPPVTFVGCRINTLQCLREITPAHVIREIDMAMKRQL